MTETTDPPNPFCESCGAKIHNFSRDAAGFRYNGDTRVICFECLNDQPVEVTLPAGEARLVLARHSEKRVAHALTLGILIGIALVTTPYVLLGQPADVFPLF
jgi:hypothetical protein